MSDTGEAKLPGIPTFRPTDKALANWVQAVTEHLEVRRGSRGNLMEKAVVKRDLVDITKVVNGLTKGKAASQTDISLEIGGGVTVNIPVDMLVDRLLANQKFKAAIASTDTTSQTTNASGDAAMNRIASELSSRIDGLAGGKKRLADDAFYLSNPTDPTLVGTTTFGGGTTASGSVARHPDAIALRDSVVFYNDITIKELMIELYKMLYVGEKAVHLSQESTLFDGQTIQDWAQYIYNTQLLAEQAMRRAEEAYQRALLP